ncbi:hypothetical protein HGB07_03010 [Candidatus Roizmanbacteria bacterium]|nr:hypothetical protein [Candidatus Roizmanbacteria bacterium]
MAYYSECGRSSPQPERSKLLIPHSTREIKFNAVTLSGDRGEATIFRQGFSEGSSSTAVIFLHGLACHPRPNIEEEGSRDYFDLMIKQTIERSHDAYTLSQVAQPPNNMSEGEYKQFISSQHKFALLSNFPYSLRAGVEDLIAEKQGKLKHLYVYAHSMAFFNLLKLDDIKQELKKQGITLSVGGSCLAIEPSVLSRIAAPLLLAHGKGASKVSDDLHQSAYRHGLQLLGSALGARLSDSFTANLWNSNHRINELFGRQLVSAQISPEIIQSVIDELTHIFIAGDDLIVSNKTIRKYTQYSQATVYCVENEGHLLERNQDVAKEIVNVIDVYLLKLRRQESRKVA